MQQSDNAVAAHNEAITIVTSVSRNGGRLVIGVPKKYQDRISQIRGVPLKVTLEPVLQKL